MGYAFSVSEKDYKEAAEDAFEKAYIQYQGREANRRDGGLYPERHYRLDGRSLKTISTLQAGKNGIFISCFHVHYGRSHESEDLRRSELDQVLRYLEKLEDDRDQGMIGDCKIQVADAANGLALRDLSNLANEINRLNKKM